MYFDDIYENPFTYRVAVRDELIKKGYTAAQGSKLVINNIPFVFESFGNMEDPKDVAECLI